MDTTIIRIGDLPPTHLDEETDFYREWLRRNGDYTYRLTRGIWRPRTLDQ